jgi:mono/diheme cytochrome c family protein
MKLAPPSPRWLICAVVVATGWLMSALRAEPATHAQGMALFTSDVKPLLVQHCVKCHGGEKTKGEFDITTRGGLLHPNDEGPNVIPGNSAKSRLMTLIRHEDDPAMPSKAPKLADAEIAKIAAWIDAGAPYDAPLIVKPGATRNRAQVSEADRQFWSFRPLSSPEVPAVKNQAWCRTPVDHFILARLEEKKIAPNGPAERRKLIRRAYLDVIGLPPAPAEVESFVNDSDPRAWEKVVDRLLASPQYGERWARHWLDLARFAESHGYEHDYDRPNAYHYRDFVIRALNEDMPYDRFVKLQIAGDELEPHNPEALLATGYLAAGTHSTQITVATAEKERYDELDDMAGTVGTSLLGLTVGCARCHDHKYDPIPTRDYYRLISTFTTTVRSVLDIDTDPAGYQKEKDAFERHHKLLTDALAKFENEELARRLEAWEARGERAKAPKWLVLEMTTAKSSGGATMTRREDGSYLVSGKRPQHDVYTFIAKAGSSVGAITAVKLEALSDPSLVKGGPGRADNGNFALSDVAVTVTKAGAKGAAPLKLQNPRATFEQKGLPVTANIYPDGTSAWAVDPQFGKDHAAVWELASPVELAAGDTITFTLKFQNNIGHGIGRPRLSVTTAPLPATLDGASGSAAALVVNTILDKPAARRTEAENKTLLAYYRSIDPQWNKLHAAVEADLKKTPQPKKLKALVCSEGVTPLRLHTALPDIPDFYTTTYFLKRGDVSQKDGATPAGPLTVLTRAPEGEKRWQVTPPAGSKLSYRRTALANWITDVDAGAGNLLARVIVNRLWQHHMGRGIVESPNDFGAQGSRPTHPELLDYLASQLVAHHWQLKPLHKLIMMSSVYTQSTAWDENRAKVDRENTLLWRRPVIRLEGEAIRDSMLYVSGQLDPTMFGPGTLDETMRRRSIYFFVKRSKLIPMMMLFDWPDSLQGLGRRSSTTVAPQALALMNHPQIRAYAQAFARRVLPVAKESLEKGIDQAYQSALARHADPTEMADALEYLRDQSDLEGAMTSFCQTLFALNEFIYVE